MSEIIILCLYNIFYLYNIPNGYSLILMNIEHTIFSTLLNITFITRSKFYVTNTVGFAVCAHFLRLIYLI